jgi:hypothetical protein
VEANNVSSVKDLLIDNVDDYIDLVDLDLGVEINELSDYINYTIKHDVI